ncbi:hypothetical protein GGI16_006799, partial [Coemansia sp. S142-1]
MDALNSKEACLSWAVEAKAKELTDVEFCYVLDELHYYKSLASPDSNIRLGAADGVWISDTLVDAETTEKLKEYVAILENIPDYQKDWCPRSKSCVLNLIDPSLHSLVYSRSRLCRQSSSSAQASLTSSMPIEFPGSLGRWREMLSEASGSESAYYLPPALPREEESDSEESAHDYDSDNDSNGSASSEQSASSSSSSSLEESDTDEQYGPYTSLNFCWLPSEFRVDDNGAVTIESYVNNLHPVKHAVLYPIIASIFSKFLPLLEQVVTDLVHPRKPGVKLCLYECYKHDSLEPECYGRPNLDYYEELRCWKEDASYVDPQPKPFVAPKRPISPYKLRGRRLQAIVKMDSIELSLKNLSYSDECWKVVGLANERIIATGVFFYDVSNIAPCSLQFREALYAKHYPQDNFEYYAMCFANGLSIEYGDKTHKVSQELGGVDIYDGQCLVFPNTLQYKMPKFTRVDATKPGHCKMLTFYFVDPSTRIPSTEIVPPQQVEWWFEEVRSCEPFRSLPLLIVDKILNILDDEAPDHILSLDDALDFRDDMVSEVLYPQAEASSEIFESNFSFAYEESEWKMCPRCNVEIETQEHYFACTASRLILGPGGTAVEPEAQSTPRGRLSTGQAMTPRADRWTMVRPLGLSATAEFANANEGVEEIDKESNGPVAKWIEQEAKARTACVLIPRQWRRETAEVIVREMAQYGEKGRDWASRSLASDKELKSVVQWQQILRKVAIRERWAHEYQEHWLPRNDAQISKEEASTIRPKKRRALMRQPRPPDVERDDGTPVHPKETEARRLAEYKKLCHVLIDDWRC